MQILLLIHAAATLYMTGLIWFVQLVHYPLMAQVGEQTYTTYQQGHERRTTWAVAPAMFIELGAAIAIVVLAPAEIAPWLAWIGLALVIMLWLSTAFIQVPCHKKLGRGFDPSTHQQLVTSNWLRTALWSGRSGIALLMLA